MEYYKTDKKANARYWDSIDAVIEIAVCDIAKFSDTEINEEVLDDLISDGIVADIRELTIKYLEEKGGTFPYVDGNM